MWMQLVTRFATISWASSFSVRPRPSFAASRAISIAKKILAKPKELSPEEFRDAIPIMSQLNTAHFTSQALFTIVKLGVPDAIGDETVTVGELASRLDGSPNEEALLRTMRLLGTVGVFEESSKDDAFAFSLTAAGALLQTSAPEPSMACGIEHNNEPPLWDAWKALPAYVAGTESKFPYEVANGMSIFEYYEQHPRTAEVFNEYVTFISARETPVLVNSFEWSSLKGKTVVDIGGGYGGVVFALADKFKGIKFISFDLPEVIASAPTPPVGVELVAGDMFDPSSIPPCDVIFMKHILHDWNDERSIEILNSCSTVLPEDGMVIVADSVLPDAGEESRLKKTQVEIDALMMLIGGKERTKSQWAAITEAANFKIERVIATSAPLCQFLVLTKGQGS